ncbi:MAG: hypothetical protein CMB80_16420, partial [Flammeovirgaceae bacterium]|nr:hypothetical protein [Flammeovirgaceae bacterium]
MPHKIIVEGFDGGGKSTIVKALSEALHQEAFYNKGPPGTVLNAIEFVQRHFEMVHNHVIMDRVTCISEYCYGFDRLSDMDERWLLVTAQLTTKDVSIVWC